MITRRLPFLSLPVTLAVILLGALPVASAQPPPAKAPLILGKAFWADKPVRDTITICLMSFDNDTEAIDTTLGKLDETDASGMSDLMLAAGPVQDSIKPKLLGDTAPTPTGRFGGGLQLSGKGALEIGPVVWGKAFGTDRTLTVDFWVKPARDAGHATLVDLPGLAGGSVLKIVRDADGTCLAEGPAGRSFRHSRPIPSDTWTHLALNWPLNGAVQLLVDGLPVSAPGELSASLGNPSATLMPRLFLGAESGLKNGFAGLLDEVRLSSGARPFYELEHDSFRDATATRPVTSGPPYFVLLDKPLIACSFDGTLTPEVFTGLKASGKANPGAFRPGIRGQAYDLSNARKDGFRLDGSGLFPMEAGTLEFWMRPLTWDNLFIGDYLGSNVRPQMLLQFGRPDYPEFRALRAVQLRQGRGLQESAADAGFLPIHPGVWTHVLCTWSPGRKMIYLNGKPQPGNEIMLNSNYLYDQPDWDKYVNSGGLTTNPSLYGWSLIPSATLIDEWRIYGRAYSSEEAANAYARWFPDAATRLAALPPIRVTPAYDYNARRLELKCTCLPVNEVDPASVHIILTGRAGSTLPATTSNSAVGKVLSTLPPTDKPEIIFDGNLTLDASYGASTSITRNLPFGDYRIEVTSFAKDGKPLTSKTIPYSRTQPVWWQNTLGKERTVPTPWTPIQATDDQLSVWGRTVTLAPGGLPAQIAAVGTNMLAAPLRLHGTAGGKDIVFQGEPVAMGPKADDERQWTGHLKAGALTADVKGSLEYDGMMTFAVTLSPAQSERDAPPLERLVLDVPFRPEVGSELIVNGGGNNFRGAWEVRFIPPGEGRVWDSLTSKPSLQKAVARGSFCPVVWIGDDDRGLCFFGENDKGWTPVTNAPAQEIRRENGAVVYRMNIIAEPVVLTKPRTFTFILHPTPTKPLPAGWRAYNRSGVNGHFANLEGIDACISPTLTAPSNSPTHLGMTFVMEPPSWEDARLNGEVLRERAGKGNPRLFYINYSWPKLGPSMAEYSGNLWSRGRMLWTREVEDYMTWIINEYIKRDIIDGIYIDDMSLGANAVPFGTAYALEDGTMQPGFNTLGFRRFLKRVHTLFLQAGKPPMIIPHMTYCFEIPALSFADACVNGEDRDIYYPAQHTYPQAWGRDELRIQGSSAKWGFITLWKNCINAEKVKPGPDLPRWNYLQGRALYALLTPSDLGVMWGNNQRNVIEPSLAAFAMGAPDLRFLPPWKCTGLIDVREARLPSADQPGGPDKPGQTNVIATCVYVWKDRALMMVSNLGSNEQVVTVSATPASLFPGTQSVTFKEADAALAAPVIPVASRDDIKKASQSMGIDLNNPDGQVDLTSPEDLLSGKKPAQKAAERLVLKQNGPTVTVLIRPYDFRLVEISPAK